MKLFKKKDVRIEFLPSAIEIVETPESPLEKFSIWAVLLVVLSVIIWSFGKVDEVAVARGKVIPSGNTNIVQSFSGGVIKSIETKEGEDVKEGQTLLTIDDSLFKNEKSKLEGQLEILSTSKDILQAYKDGKNPDIDKEKLKTSKDIVNEQLGYSKTIESMYLNQLNTLDIEITKSKEELQKITQKLSEEENNLAKLNKELEDLKQTQASSTETTDDKQLGINEKQNYINISNSQINSLRESIKNKEDNLKIQENSKNNYILNHKQELEKELVKVFKSIELITKDIEKIEKQMKELVIKSPVEGKVQNLAVNTVGGVVQSGAPIVHIVPKNKELIIEAMVLNKDIGFVSKGQKTQVKFDTFDFQRYGTVEGTITDITPDAVTVNNEPMYKASVKLKEKDIEVNEKKMKFSPGMTVTCEIDIGQRRILDFFIPGIKDVKNSFKLR